MLPYLEQNSEASILVIRSWWAGTGDPVAFISWLLLTHWSLPVVMLSYLEHRVDLSFVPWPVPFGEVEEEMLAPFPSEEAAAPDPSS